MAGSRAEGRSGRPPALRNATGVPAGGSAAPPSALRRLLPQILGHGEGVVAAGGREHGFAEGVEGVGLEFENLRVVRPQGQQVIGKARGPGGIVVPLSGAGVFQKRLFSARRAAMRAASSRVVKFVYRCRGLPSNQPTY